MTPNDAAAFWSMSFYYTDWKTAGAAYERCRDSIFARDIDASAYRILLNQKAYVVVVGFGLPADDLVTQINTICIQGESTDIPDEVVLTLAIRHGQFASQPGTKFERRSHI